MSEPTPTIDPRPNACASATLRRGTTKRPMPRSSPGADLGQRAEHGEDVAAQRQLAEHHDAHHIVPGDLTRGGEHTERQRQVERGADLRDGGRGTG
ncbi:MAG: hypothetical protein OXQ31_24145 [Spirochaetaceae bacterium]|nr:hypothetical protein [Spirochaetaceae bacterium]